MGEPAVVFFDIGDTLASARFGADGRIAGLDVYPFVTDVLARLRARTTQVAGLGLISNTHRCLASFQSHFDLDHLISVAVSSSEHGFMKPHPSIFRAALELMGVAPAEAVMVGDSLPHDVIGARQAGMHSVLLARGERRVDAGPEVPVIRTLAELPSLIETATRPLGAATRP